MRGERKSILRLSFRTGWRRTCGYVEGRQSSATQAKYRNGSGEPLDASRHGVEVSYKVQIVVDHKHKLVVEHEVPMKSPTKDNDFLWRRRLKRHSGV